MRPSFSLQRKGKETEHLLPQLLSNKTTGLFLVIGSINGNLFGGIIKRVLGSTKLTSH